MIMAADLKARLIDDELKVRKKTFLTRCFTHKVLLIMCLPAIVIMLIFTYGPMIGVVTAFQNYQPIKGFFGSTFVGFQNFTNLLSTSMLKNIIRNTLGLSLLKLIIGFPTAIVFALLLNEVRRTTFKRTIQTISYLPHFISWVVVIGIWGKLLSVDGGVLNNLIAVLFHTDNVVYLASSWFMWPFAIFSEMWKEMGWSAIIYLAALSGINPELYEAAIVDGAGRPAQLWHITLPGLRSTIAILLILAIPGIVGSNTDQMWVLGTLPVRDVTEVIDTYVLRTGLGSAKYGIAAAAGLMKSVLSFVLLFIADRGAKAMGEDGIL